MLLAATKNATANKRLAPIVPEFINNSIIVFVRRVCWC